MATAFQVLQSAYEVRYHVLGLLVSYILYLQWASYRRLAQFRGPFWASLTNLWMAQSISKRKSHLDLFEVSEKYGELARIGPNILLTSDPELVIRMSSARSPYTRADWYAGQKFEADHDNLFSNTDEKTHVRRRAQMMIGYSGKEIDNLEAIIDKHLLELIDLIKWNYLSVGSELKPMDLARKSAFFTMDVITELAFGHSWGCLPRDEDVGSWFESNEKMLPRGIMFSSIPWLAKVFLIPAIGRLFLPSETEAVGSGRLIKVLKDAVDKRFATEDYDQKSDIMGSFIRHGITSKQEAVTEASLAIVAGSDTTATTIRTTLLYIITNPLVYKKLQYEIDCTDIGIAPVISDAIAKRLPYLQAVIKEGARILPPASGLLSKKTPPQGDTINGIFVPGGIDIGQCAWGLQRSKAVYGEDAMMFRPERWLEAEKYPERLEMMERSLGLVWGHGKYSCPGKAIAWLEFNKVYFQLLRHFEFTLIDPTRPWKSECVGLWLQSELFVKVNWRSVSSIHFSQKEL